MHSLNVVIQVKEACDDLFEVEHSLKDLQSLIYCLVSFISYCYPNCKFQENIIICHAASFDSLPTFQIPVPENFLYFLATIL